MTDADELAFAACFLKLRNVFHLKGDRADVQQVMRVYFQVLRWAPLARVEAGAEAWIARESRFPKPAEWARALPAPRVAVPELTGVAAIEHRHAVALGYQDEPCNCAACDAAGVTHRFLRFVPELDEHDQDVRVLLDGKRVTRGHWAHGAELARWYVARDQYLALRVKYPPKTMAMRSTRRRVQTPLATAMAEEIKASIARNEELERVVAVAVRNDA